MGWDRASSHSFFMASYVLLSPQRPINYPPVLFPTQVTLCFQSQDPGSCEVLWSVPSLLLPSTHILPDKVLCSSHQPLPPETPGLSWLTSSVPICTVAGRCLCSVDGPARPTESCVHSRTWKSQPSVYLLEAASVEKTMIHIDAGTESPL